MSSVYEHLRGEVSMEPIGDVVLELDAGQWPLVNLLGVQHHKFCAVCLRDIQLHQDKAVILCSLCTALPSQTWHEDRLSYDPMGVPHLSGLV